METMSPLLNIAADLFAVRELGPWLHATVSSTVPEFSADEIVGPIELALHELCINIVEHSYQGAVGSIRLSGARIGDQLVFMVSDIGSAFDGDLGNVRDTQEHTIRGYGLAILQQLASRVDYERVDSANNWRVAFALPSATTSTTTTSTSTTTNTISTNKGMKQ
jgi:serine/threonine-protein kinase RsbW